MTKVEKLRFFLGGRVTVGTITQVRDKELKEFFVAKIRGIVVGDNNDYLHETAERARQYGKEIFAYWKDELANEVNDE